MQEKEIVLDEDWYNSCIYCKKKMYPKNPYDYYCSKGCKEKDEIFIKDLAEQMAKAYGDD